jgi:hypothetical protein
MLSFSWTYDYERGGATVYVTPSDGGEEVELGLVNNGNIAQALCDVLSAMHTGTPFTPRFNANDRADGACLSWLGYINPPPASETFESERRC